MEEPSEPDDICRSCGEQLHPSDNFCPSCGTETQFADPGVGDVTAERPDQTVQPDGTGTGHRGPDRRVSTGWEEQPAGAGQRSGPGAPETRTESESPIKTVGIAVGLSAAGIVIPLLFLSVLAVAFGAIGLTGPPVLVFLTLLQFAWFGAFAIWYLRNRGYDWDGVKSYFGVDKPTLKQLGLILVTWLVMMIAAVIVGSILMQLVGAALGSPDTEPAQNPIGDIIAENPEIVLGAIAFMFLVVGPCEEILFRGVVQNRLRERFSKVPGIAIASFLFASIHVFALAGQDPVGISMTISVLFVTSLGLGWIYEYTGNIVIPALLHGFHNSVIVAVTAISAVSGAEAQEAVLLVPDLINVVIL